MGRVLIVDDEPQACAMMARLIRHFGHETACRMGGQEALDYLCGSAVDLLILDVMMPGMDGIEVCRQLRRESDLLVLMLTARVDEDDLLLGLDTGADDYLTKPYSPRELVARIRTLLRRSQRGPAGGILQIGRLRLDPGRHRVFVEGEQVECTPGEFAILVAMAEQPDRVFTRGQLLRHTSGIDRASTERTIDVHVMNLRRKIEPDPRRPACLLTVYGIGYKLTSS
jgi:two-component system response regulator MtrA